LIQVLAQTATGDLPQGWIAFLALGVTQLVGAAVWASKLNARTSVIEQRLQESEHKLTHIELFGNRLTRIETMLEQIQRDMKHQ
jgi:hypothetical protein